MSKMVEVKSGVTISLDGLRAMRVVDQQEHFILRADYAIGTVFDLAWGTEAEIRELYDRMTGLMIDDAKALAPMPMRVRDMIEVRRYNGKGGL